MAVVTSAMMTIIAKTLSLMTARSRPTLRITNSINPRVFIRMPMADASRQSFPSARAAMNDPPNFPRQATKIISSVSISIALLPSNPS